MPAGAAGRGDGLEGGGVNVGVLTLVLGGARSGKSRFAAGLALGSGPRVVYVATGVVTDPEMAARVARHRAERPPGWTTVEEPLQPSQVVEAHASADAVLVDCLSFAVSNRLLAAWGDNPKSGVVETDRLGQVERAVLEEVGRLVRAAAAATGHVIVVSNEVGLAPVPETPLTRAFRDLLGQANQAVARAAQAVYVMWAGIPVNITDLDARRRTGPGGGPVR